MVRFRPSAAATLTLLPLVVVAAGLGYWQIDRMHEKQALVESFESAPTITLEDAIADSIRFARISATGRFDTARHILLDNQVYQGKAGVHVYTPFRTFSGDWVLVNRGWKPLSADRELPDIWTPAVPVGIRGRLDRPPDQFDGLGEPDALATVDGAQLVTYFDIADIAGALEIDLPPWVVLLDGEDPNGFDGRDWQPIFMKPEHHGAYAFQWYSLCAALFLAWLIAGIRRAKSGR